MLIVPGSKVMLRFTGERGEVVCRLDEDTLLIRLEGESAVEIPAFEEDVVPITVSPPAAPATSFEAKSPTKTPSGQERRVVKSTQKLTNSQGISLVFEPMLGRDEVVSRYTIWLLNDTYQECLFELVLETSVRVVLETEGKLETATAVEVGTLFAADLSDHPQVFITCRPISTEGVEAPVERSLRIRPKTFFNARQFVPILGIEAYRFILFKPQITASVQSPSTDLRELARSQRCAPAHTSESNTQIVDPYDVVELAEFKGEIDLHAEKLLPNYKSLDPGQILHLQLACFRDFLEKAIRLGVPKVFVIHGVGEGKLREAIAKELRHHPAVWKFKNEYHPKYGYGATEVIFY
ncbi:MAG: Smr/MutS family protein [Saprospiraceae bacterium]|nr:Smr/MutS family protein [Saprospiraceae bacterium]MDW8484327.1 Smr/MutS family protein [Saprospiraceae bacterium]